MGFDQHRCSGFDQKRDRLIYGIPQSSLGDIFKEVVSWFKKSTQEKIEDGQAAIDKKTEEMKKSGRG